ncbi:aspartyl protease family protein [Polaribacter aquimarinus]|uniref:Peptidase A2 domain-containing protein n=1 Tax=Polaribacter aquimarinus TaxID=2100726 RepID=A0A2U2JAQ9_9FLAO|nr:aspartyl protease family protein [Polaribacter aquimarinus]PWG05361.1 hypothetical protein DIS07_09015 [Polaribacter aquimarinus]
MIQLEIRNKLFFIVFCFFTWISNSQTGFQFKNPDKNHQVVSFKKINNLIVIPLKINGKKLSFILDTGVNKTILFSLSANDSISLLNTRKMKLKGLGGGDSVDALISQKNTVEIKGIKTKNETIFVVLKDFFNLSGKMGTTIHGIIGYSLFKNFIVKINYKTNRLHFYNPKTFDYEKCKKCFSTDLRFYRKKPYINTKVVLDTVSGKTTDVKMLIDTGGSDAIWLLEKSKKNIVTPNRFFNDILGEGLSGTIYGNRSRIPTLILGDYRIKEPTCSFLDSLSTVNARKFTERNGSIGGGILSRFKIWIDYRNHKIVFKKNGSFKKGFNYNMSGLDVVYSGKELVRERAIQKFYNSYDVEVDKRSSISLVTRYEYRFKPSYKINKVVVNSPADKAGLKKDDKIIKINGKPAHELTMADILYKFQEKHGRKIKITIERNGERMTLQFRLEKKV